ncbi:MAG TPA: porphobilinogen synthase, partial [bacterium]
MGFPTHRLRRLRNNAVIRCLVKETELSVNDLIYPLFVEKGSRKKTEVKSMPGVYRFSLDSIAKEAKDVEQLGIPAIILFGIPEKKDPRASGAYAENGVVQQALRAIRAEAKKILLITDVCLCEYTDHGHCGIVGKDGSIENDPTLELLAK